MLAQGSAMKRNRILPLIEELEARVVPARLFDLFTPPGLIGLERSAPTDRDSEIPSGTEVGPLQAASKSPDGRQQGKGRHAAERQLGQLFESDREWERWKRKLERRGGGGGITLQSNQPPIVEAGPAKQGCECQQILING
jgi:hypothetical protein